MQISQSFYVMLLMRACGNMRAFGRMSRIIFLALFGQYFLLKNNITHTRLQVYWCFAPVAPHCADTQYYEGTVVVWL